MLKQLKDKSGASIIVVIIVSVIFLVLGVGVLTAASVSAGASVKNRDNKQLFYYAKSAAETLNNSIKSNDGLGHDIVDIIALMVMNKQDVPSNMVLDSNIVLKRDNGSLYNEVTYSDVKIKLSGILTHKTQNFSGSGGTYIVNEAYLINISKVTISFVTNYNGLQYKMDIDYSFRANGSRSGQVSGTPPINSIDDLDLNQLEEVVSWEDFTRTFIKVHQGG